MRKFAKKKNLKAAKLAFSNGKNINSKVPNLGEYRVSTSAPTEVPLFWTVGLVCWFDFSLEPIFANENVTHFTSDPKISDSQP